MGAKRFGKVIAVIEKYLPIVKRLKKTLLPFFVGTLVILTPIIYILFRNPGNTQAIWSPTLADWAQRQQLNIVNTSAVSLSANTTIAITVDTKTLAAQAKIKPDCSDLRIAYQPNDTTNTVLNRHIVYPSGETCGTSTATKVYFPLQASLSSAGTATSYYVYFGNQQATSPTNTPDAFDIGAIDALLVCPFEGATTCAAGETPSTATGALRYSTSKSALDISGYPKEVDLGSNPSLDDLPNADFTIETWIYPKTPYAYYSYLSGVKSGTSVGYYLYWHVSARQPSFTIFTTGGTYSFTSATGLTLDQWQHLAIVWNATAKTAQIYINGVSQVASPVPAKGTYNSDAAYNKAIGSATYTERQLNSIIDEYRISNIKRYTGNFTPTTTPFIRDEYTKLLLHFDENGDDPRNTGKAIDDSGNGNHGTITGAKYIAGLVGVDNSSTTTGYESSGSYAGHGGVFMEEGTTNKITNPSFDHATYNTGWTATSTVTPAENTTAPFYKFGSKSAQLVAASDAGALDGGGGGGGEGNPTMEHHLEIISQVFETRGNSAVPTDNSLGLVYWDADKYPDSAVYFEVVMMETDTSGSAEAQLYTAAGDPLGPSLLSYAGSDGVYTRYRSDALTLADNTDYTVRISNSTTGRTAIKEARLVIVQTKEDGITTSQSNMELGYPEATSNDTFTQLTSQKAYYYDSSKFDPIPTAYVEATVDVAEPKIEQKINILNQDYKMAGADEDNGDTHVFLPGDNSLGVVHWDSTKYSGETVYLEVVMTENGNGDCFAALYDTDGTLISNEIAGGEPGGVYVTKRSTALTLVDGTAYTVRLRNDSVGAWSFLRSASLVVVQSDTTKITDTETLAEVGSAENTSSATYITPSYPKLYYYDSSVFSPTPTTYFEASFRPAEAKVTQQINIMDQVYSTTSGTAVPTDNSLGLINWDADKFPADSVEVFFEVSFTETGSGDCSAALYNTLGEEVDGSAVTGSKPGGVYVRKRSSTAISLIDGTDYSVRVKNTVAGQTTLIKSARLIVVQTGTTKLTTTQTYIEVGNNETSTQTAYTQLTDKKIYTYDADVYAPAPTTYFEATIANDTAGQTTSLALYENAATCVTEVASSEITVVGTTWARVRSSAITLSDSASYMVCMKTSANTAKVSNAKIIHEQTDAGGITKLELVHTLDNTLVTTVSTSYATTGHVYSFNPMEYGVAPIVYLDTTQKTTTGKTAFSTFHVDPVGSDGDAYITESELTTTSTSYVQLRSPELSAVMPKNPLDIATRIKNTTSGGTGSFSNTSVVLQLQNIPTGGTAGGVELYNYTDTASVADSEVTSATKGWQTVRSSAITLTTAKTYTMRLKNAVVASAKVVLVQSAVGGITDLEIPITLVNNYKTSVDPSYGDGIEYPFYFDNEAYGTRPTVKHEVVVKTSDAGESTYTDFYKQAISTITAAVITGSEQSTNAIIWTRQTTGDLYLDLPFNTRSYITRFRPTSGGTASISQSTILIQIANLPNAGATGSIGLYDKTTGASVAASETTTTTTGLRRLRSAGFTLTTGKEYVFEMKQARIVSAKLILEQNSTILETQLMHYASHIPTSEVDNNYDRKYGLLSFDPANWAGTSAVARYFQAYAKVSASDGNIDLYNVSTAATVTSSNINITPTSYTRTTSGDIAAGMPAVANELDIRMDATSGNYVYAQYSGLLTDITFALAQPTAEYSTAVSPGGITTHTLSAYVFNGTTGEIGSPITESNARLVWEGGTVDATSDGAIYTDVGGGWYRITYSHATSDASNDYGVAVAADKTMYVDGMQLEEKTYATSYADGTLGTGYAWTDTGHESTSTRTADTLQYAVENNISTTTFSLGFWTKAVSGTATQVRQFIDPTSGQTGPSIRFQPAVGGFAFFDNSGATIATYTSATMTLDKWYFVTAVRDGSAGTSTIYVNGSAGTPQTTAFGFDTTNFGVGYNPSGNGGPSDATMSDLRIYNAALTSTQVADLYSAGLVSRSETAGSITIDRFSDNKGQDITSVWHFDEGYGTTANDSSINLNHLTTSGATWTRNANNSYLSYDGTNDFAYRNFDRDFDFGSNEFTLSGLFKHPSTISGTDTVLSRQSGTTGYKIYMDSSGYMCFSVNSDSACITTSYADSKWHSFSAVRSSASLTLYIDGTPAVELARAAPATVNGNNPIYIGIDSDGTANPWTGYIDEVSIYPYARSAAQVLTDNLGQQVAVSIGTRENDNLTDGLVGWWKMNEASWTVDCSTYSVLDASGNANNGKACPNSTGPSGGVVGKFGNSGDLVTDDYVQFTSEIYFAHGAPWSTSYWIYPNDVKNNIPLGVNLQGSYIYTYVNGASSKIGARNRDSQSPTDVTVTMNNTTWYLVTAVADGTGLVKMYLNGEYKGSSNPGSNGSGIRFDRFGRAYPNNDAFSINARLDDVRIYNRALSGAEIDQLYSWAPAPVAHWNFDEGTGISANDSSGNGNTGTLTGATHLPTWTKGKFGKGIKFDGNDDYVTAGDISSVESQGALTAEAWVKVDGAGTQYEGIISKNMKIDLLRAGGLGGNDDIFVRINDGSNPYAYTTGNILTNNIWHHVAMVFDGAQTGNANRLKLYFNGALQTLTFSGTVPTSTGSDSTPLLIGKYTEGSAYLSGATDDVRIYNYARSEKQVIADMNAGHAAPGSPTPSALVHYKFDEGYLTSSNNSGNGGSSLNGTLSNATWSNSGKYGKALSFDGDGDYVQVNTAADLSAELTFSTWFKTSSLSTQTLISNENIPVRAGPILQIHSSGMVMLFDGVACSSASGIGYNDGDWHHAVATINPSGTYSIYVDGNLADYDTCNIYANPTDRILVGAHYSNNVPGTNPFSGILDEVKIYNFALSAEQVKTEYNHGTAQSFGALSTDGDGATPDNSADRGYCVPGDTSSCSDPIAEWNFDDGAGSTAYDKSGNSYDGILVNSPSWSPGKFGKALEFDSALNTSVNIYSANFANAFDTSEGTAELWFKANSSIWTDGVNHRLLYIAADTDNRVTLHKSTLDNQLQFYYIAGGTNSGVSTSSSSYTDWTHAVITWSKSSDAVRAYINGKQEGSTVSSLGTWTGSIDETLANIGSQLSTGSSEWDGGIDQVRIYDYARTPAQVAWDYNQGGPRGWWRMDETTGTVSYDASGNGINGTLTNGVTLLTNGKLNYGYTFNGSDGYVDIGAGPNVVNSISFWINPTSATEYPIDLNGSAYVWINGGTITAQGFSSPTIFVNGIPSTTLSAGIWQHVVISTATSLSATDFDIGRIEGMGNLEGDMDDVKIWTYTLTATQAKIEYNNGAINFEE